MPFELGACVKDRQSIERPAAEFVQSLQNPEANCCAASESATARNLLDCRTGESKRSPFCSLEEQISRLGHDLLLTLPLVRAKNCNRVVNPQRYAKAIESRAEIRGAGRNLDGDALPCHVERSRDISYYFCGMTQ